MTNLRKLTTTVATGALLLNAFTSIALASTTIQVSGNGSFSDNTAKVDTQTTTTVEQSNTASVTNNVQSQASTGGNSANDNTGGDTTIKTGDALNTTDVSTSVNLNKADVSSCGCASGDSSVTISGNGTASDNYAHLDKSNTTQLFQTNAADVVNNVDAKASTGANDANRNTGGNVYVKTGGAESDVQVSTAANANTANVGGNGVAGGSSTDLKISGNGSFSANKVGLDNNNSIAIVQGNEASIVNNVDSSAKTGYNDANDNTGADTVISTGWAGASASIDNMANFNAATAGCGCADDVLAKVAGNGTDSYNKIWADLGNSLSVFQDGNAAEFANNVDSNAKTGANDSNRNTGTVVGDATGVFTGGSLSNTTVSNSGNVNVFGPGEGYTLPGGVQLNFSFDLNSLLSLLHMS